MRIPRAWLLSGLVVMASWIAFFGAFPLIPASQRISVALASLLVCGVLVMVVNAGMPSPGRRTTAYRLFLLWGASLPLLVAYLSPLVGGDSVVLPVNIVFVILLLAWGLWTLEVLSERRALGFLALAGACLIAFGVVVTAASWGSATLADRPMMPYMAYMEAQSSLYVGLFLISAGAILHICGRERVWFSKLARALVRRARLAALLVLAFGLTVGLLVAYDTFVNRPPHIRLTDLQFDRADLTYRVDQDITVSTRPNNVAVVRNSAEVSVVLRVYNSSGFLVHEETLKHGHLSVTPAPGKKVTRTDHFQSVAGTFSVSETGEYRVEVSAYDHKTEKRVTEAEEILVVPAVA